LGWHRVGRWGCPGAARKIFRRLSTFLRRPVVRFFSVIFYDSVPYLSRTILTSIPLYRFFNKLSDVQPMKISGIQSSPLSPFERHRQSSTKPPSTRRSSLLPHNKAANRFTTESPWSGPRPGEYAIKLYTFCPHRCEGGSETWLERSTGLAL
jgi:hypothetical protein